MEKREKSFVHWSLAALGLALITPGAPAAVIFDSGLIPFTATGNQFGRVTRDGIASDWSGTKFFPGVIDAPTLHGYDLITVNTGPFSFIQISMDNPAATLFDAAYINSYAPVNSAPNFGLDANYLGDPGSTQPFGNPNFFQILLAPNTDLLISIHEVTPGGGTGTLFSLLVEGFFDSSFNDVPTSIPEPSTIILTTLGGLLWSVLGRKNRHLG